MVVAKIIILVTDIVNKDMRNTIILTCMTVVLAISQGAARAVPTKWEEVQPSMSELINSGWQISAHGTNRVAANSNAGNGFDQSQFSFLLTKNGNYIICIADNPRPPIAYSAGCRRLN
jgi:hypothetical protein